MSTSSRSTACSTTGSFRETATLPSLSCASRWRAWSSLLPNLFCRIKSLCSTRRIRFECHYSKFPRRSVQQDRIPLILHGQLLHRVRGVYVDLLGLRGRFLQGQTGPVPCLVCIRLLHGIQRLHVHDTIGERQGRLGLSSPAGLRTRRVLDRAGHGGSAQCAIRTDVSGPTSSLKHRPPGG